MKLRKTINVLCSLAMIVSALPSASAAETEPVPADPAKFTDAADIQHWDAVATLSKLGVISGKDDGSFDPAGTITRAEAAKMISVAINGGSETVTGVKAQASFDDIAGTWAEGYIEYCVDLGIISGRGDGIFDPNGQVTVIELVKMTLAMLGYDPAAYRLTGKKWDARTDELARSIDPSLYSGLSGVSVTAPATRDDAAQMLYNALQNKPRIITSLTDGETGEVTWQHAAGDKTFLQERFDLTWDEVGGLPAQPTAE